MEHTSETTKNGNNLLGKEGNKYKHKYDEVKSLQLI